MPSLSEDDFTAVLVQVLHEAMMQGEPVHLPKLGTFRVQHEESRIHAPASGPVRLDPPRDTIEFVPDA